MKAYSENVETAPVIIYSRRRLDKVSTCVKENFGTVKYEFPFIRALCVEMPLQKLEAVKHHTDVVHICFDSQVSKVATLHNRRFQHHTPSYSNAPSSNSPVSFKTSFAVESGGAGVGIAVIDTGIIPHYDFIKPTNRILAFKDFINNQLLPYDDDGHGTHVTGIVAGNGFATGGKCCGTAPKSNIISLKALDANGNGNMSDILAAMQWVSDNQHNYNICVVNLSLGVNINHSGLSDGMKSLMDDPLVVGAEALVRKGITVVAAAGNSGPEEGSITSPGVSPLVVTVGAVDPNGVVPPFSGRGFSSSSACCAKKPDLVACGTDILSCYKTTHKSYLKQSGTSMAAPFVAGIAACMYAENPKISPEKVKNYMIKTAKPLSDEPKHAQGAGLLKV